MIKLGIKFGITPINFDILDESFDLRKLKQKGPEIYEKIISWETRFYWFCFDEWINAHVRRSVPRYLKRDWDYAIKVSLKNPVHRQAWEQVIIDTDFWGYRDFNRFISDCIKQG